MNTKPTPQQVVSTLLEYWNSRPYLRLGQIVSNAFRIHPNYKKNPEPEIQDVFYMSDVSFLEGIDRLKNNESKNPGSTES